MKFVIISFKSRNNVQMFAKIMRSYSIPAEIISTPRSISISCGLSVKTSYNYLSTTYKLLQSSNLENCLGIFILEKHGIKETTQRIY